MDDFRTYPVEATCRDCGHSWLDTEVVDYGRGGLECHEQCPACGSREIDTAALESRDIEELRLESRGVDF